MCLGLDTPNTAKCIDHQTPPRRFCTLFFEVLPFTDDASVVNGKTSKKSMKNDAAVFGVSRPLDSYDDLIL